MFKEYLYSELEAGKYYKDEQGYYYKIISYNQNFTLKYKYIVYCVGLSDGGGKDTVQYKSGRVYTEKTCNLEEISTLEGMLKIGE